MFSIRVDEAPNPALRRTMYAAAKYSVVQEAGQFTLVLERPASDGETQRESVVVAGGSIAYVMNEQGTTIDIIRSNARRAS